MIESRRVIKIQGSLYVCLPASLCEELAIEKGDRCVFSLLPGYGLLLRKEGEGSKESIALEDLANLHQEADQIFHETRRKLRGLENQVVSNVWMKITGLLFKHGAFLLSPSPGASGDPHQLTPPKTRALKE